MDSPEQRKLCLDLKESEWTMTELSPWREVAAWIFWPWFREWGTYMSAYNETDTILDVLYTSSHVSLTTVFQADVFPI